MQGAAGALVTLPGAVTSPVDAGMTVGCRAGLKRQDMHQKGAPRHGLVQSERMRTPSGTAPATQQGGSIDDEACCTIQS